MPANGDFMLPVVTRFRFFAGTRRVHFGTGGHPRARATPRDTAWDVLETLDRDHLLEKFLQNRLGVAHTDATLTPSFAREGAYGFDWCDTTSANPDAPRIAARARASNPCHVSPRDGLVRSARNEDEFPVGTVRRVADVVHFVSMRDERRLDSARSRKRRVESDVSACPSAKTPLIDDHLGNVADRCDRGRARRRSPRAADARRCRQPWNADR
jgi:hypothetical protein